MTPLYRLPQGPVELPICCSIAKHAGKVCIMEAEYSGLCEIVRDVCFFCGEYIGNASASHKSFPLEHKSFGE